LLLAMSIMPKGIGRLPIRIQAAVKRDNWQFTIKWDHKISLLELRAYVRISYRTCGRPSAVVGTAALQRSDIRARRSQLVVRWRRRDQIWSALHRRHPQTLADLCGTINLLNNANYQNITVIFTHPRDSNVISSAVLE
jgi:hypothetical protein